MIFRILLVILVFTINVVKVSALNIETDILNGKTSMSRVAFVSFYVDSNSSKYYSEIQQNVSKYLSNSAVVNLRLVVDNIIKDTSDIEAFNVDLTMYKDFDYAVLGKMYYQNNEYKVEIIVFDTKANKKKLVKRYVVTKKNIKKSVDWLYKNLTNDIYFATTGLQGYFSSSLVYVANSNKLMLANFDGHNSTVLIKSKNTLYGPSFSPNNSLIAYVELVGGFSKIYLYNLQTKKSILLGAFDGLSLSPRFSNDGTKLAFSLAKDGNTNMAEIDLPTGSVRYLTRSAFINLPGDYIDSNSLLFYSDVSGKSSVYKLDLTNLKATKISKGNGSYFTPSYSDSYSLVVFTKIINNRFHIGVLDLDGREKLVTEDNFAESPSWAADGRHVIYQYVYKVDNVKNYYIFALLDVLTGRKIIIQPQDDVADPVLSKSALFNDDYGLQYNLLDSVLN